MEKIYKVPHEIIEKFIEWQALTELREAYVKRPFGYRKARKLSMEAILKRVEGWRMIYELYPELQDYKLFYEQAKEEVLIVGKKLD